MTQQEMAALACGQLPSKYSADTINGLSAYTISRLSADTISRLSADTINGLSADTISRLSAYTISRLSADTISRLSADTINGLSADTISRLSADTISRLSADTISRLSADTINGLSADTISRLNAYTAAALSAAIEKIMTDVPLLTNPYGTMLAQIEAGERRHDQNTFGPEEDPKTNLCGTQMCTAGHLVNMAGKEGYALKDRYGWAMAATLIHRKARPDVPPQDFGSIPQEWAIAYIRERAAEEIAAAQ